jgi:MraZ protein
MGIGRRIRDDHIHWSDSRTSVHGTGGQAGSHRTQAGVSPGGTEAGKRGENRVLFVGTHERQLDEKGRLALPAPFRSHLGERCYLAVGDDQCINVVPAERFEAMAADLVERVRRGEVDRQYQRVVSASATPVQVDRQGRVVVDANLRAYAGLTPESKVIVSGNFDVIEIWAPAQFELIQQAGTQAIAGGIR